MTWIKEVMMQENEMEYFKSFRDVCKAMSSSLNLKEVLDLIVNNVTMILNTKACTIFLINREKKRLEISASYGLSETYLKKGPLDVDKSIIASLAGKSVLVYDATNDSRIQYPEGAREEGVASILSVPMPVKGEVIGVLRIYTPQPRNFSDNENEFISGLAEMGGIAIENARMYDYLKADHDNLINEVHQWFEYGRT
jgi:signal transduction protein with GAF and PtsI domain